MKGTVTIHAKISPVFLTYGSLRKEGQPPASSHRKTSRAPKTQMRCISLPAILLCSHHEINAGVASGNHVSWTRAASKQEEVTQILQSQLPLLKCGPKLPGLPHPGLLHCSKAKPRCYRTGRVCTKIFWDERCHVFSSNSGLRVLSTKAPYSCLERSNIKEKG